MNKSILLIASGLLAVALALAVTLLVREPAPVAAPAARPALHFDQNAGTEERIRALEAAVAEERNARMLLEDELQALYAALDELGETRTGNVSGEDGRDAGFRFQDGLRQGSEADAAWRRDRLVTAGFSEDRADWILRRESELLMQRMQVMYEVRRTGERPPNFRQIMDPDAALRTEVGDAEYEQYLKAFGRSISVTVGSVLESSPGQRAGIQPGDEIMAYGGERVFSYDDLSGRTMAAAPGQPVVVDIVRDGVPMQVVIEGGPIGISNNRYMRPGRR
ncbi:MAG: PDZ domain-containing protein [Woeseiaceae bacterium]|nr:PDZ domain-containing protein [Woeseiaceae bacterium]